MARDALIDEYFDSVSGMVKAWKMQYREMMAGQNLSFGQISIMFLLRDKQPISSAKLADEMQVTRGMVSQLVDGLDALGFIAREPDAADRRIVYLRLTEAASERLAELERERRAVFADVASQLSDDELQSMITIQQKLNRAMQARQKGNL